VEIAFLAYPCRRRQLLEIIGGNTAGLVVHSLDLSSFGVGAGIGVSAIRISAPNSQLDLLRSAGFTVVPEPSTALLLATGLAALAISGRRP
jgi:hypothetical protein